MSISYAMAASRTPAADLPAYRYREPVRTWLDGYAPQTAHRTWEAPPTTESVESGVPGDDVYDPLRIRQPA